MSGFLGAILVIAAAAGGDGVPDRAAAAVDAYASQLKAALGGAMQSGGPVEAIEVCRNRASEIAAEIGREAGVDIGRTALRVRNPGNQPDEWEMAVLRRFEAELAAGAAAEELFAVDTKQTASGMQHRYMAPIMTQPLCLACHGSALDPAVKDALQAHYPDDEATGFAIGDLRGAFTVSWIEAE